MFRGMFLALIGICVTSLLLGCQPGKHPFLIAQICLTNQDNYLAFVDELRMISRSQNMVFTDNTLNTRDDLAAIDAGRNTNIDVERVIDLHVAGADGMGLGAGNLGLPNYQVAIGFSEGADSARARRFADYVVSRLRTKWRVEIVPTGEGARPIRGC